MLADKYEDIALTLREPFDYTVWQRSLWKDKSIEEISRMATQYHLAQSGNE